MIKVSVVMTAYNEENLVIRALNTIPDRDDIEIVIVEDCSTDNTLKVLQNYIKEHPNRHIKLFENKINSGHGFGINKCYDNATGEWLVELGSDDAFMTGTFEDIMDNDLTDDYDLVYYNIRNNDRRLYKSPNNPPWVGAVKFIRRSFLGDSRATPRRFGHDGETHKLLWDKNPRVKYTGKLLYLWNQPKENTLTWKKLHGKIDSKGNEI